MLADRLLDFFKKWKVLGDVLIVIPEHRYPNRSLSYMEGGILIARVHFAHDCQAFGD
jgi:hypothetical protein